MLEFNLQNFLVKVIVVSESLTLFIYWVSLVKLWIFFLIKSQLFNLDALHFRLISILLNFLDSHMSGYSCSCCLASLSILSSLSFFSSFAFFSGFRLEVNSLIILWNFCFLLFNLRIFHNILDLFRRVIDRYTMYIYSLELKYGGTLLDIEDRRLSIVQLCLDFLVWV